MNMSKQWPTLVLQSLKYKQTHTQRLMWEFIGAICLSKMKQRSFNTMIGLIEQKQFLDCLEKCIYDNKDAETKAMAIVAAKLLSQTIIFNNKFKKNKNSIAKFKQLWKNLSHHKVIGKQLTEEIMSPTTKTKRVGGFDPCKTNIACIIKFGNCFDICLFLFFACLVW